MIPMATIPTNLENSINASDTRAKLDAVAKKLVKHRIILAEILKECVEEFKDFDIKYIEDNCFVGEVQVNEVWVRIPESRRDLYYTDNTVFQ